jgi:hypothetical protein
MRNIDRLSLRSLRQTRRETIRQCLKLVRLLKGKSPSTEYDWGCDVPRRGASRSPRHRIHHLRAPTRPDDLTQRSLDAALAECLLMALSGLDGLCRLRTSLTMHPPRLAEGSVGDRCATDRTKARPAAGKRSANGRGGFDRGSCSGDGVSYWGEGFGCCGSRASMGFKTFSSTPTSPV